MIARRAGFVSIAGLLLAGAPQAQTLASAPATGKIDLILVTHGYGPALPVTAHQLQEFVKALD